MGATTDMPAGEPFEMRDSLVDGDHTLILTGELDMAAAPDVESRVATLCIDGVRSISLDLSKLTFIDSVGIRAVLHAQELCRDHGYEFLVAPGSPSVHRVFELLGLLDALPFVEG